MAIGETLTGDNSGFDPEYWLNKPAEVDGIAPPDTRVKSLNARVGDLNT